MRVLAEIGVGGVDGQRVCDTSSTSVTHRYRYGSFGVTTYNIGSLHTDTGHLFASPYRYGSFGVAPYNIGSLSL